MKVRLPKLEKTWQQVVFLIVLAGVGLMVGMMVGRGGEKVDWQEVKQTKESLKMGLQKGGELVDSNKDVFVVVGWDPRMAELTYKASRLSRKQEKKTIILLKTAVLLRENGREEIVMSIRGSRWQHLFCPGDKIKVMFNENGEWKRITNLGPRSCGK